MKLQKHYLIASPKGGWITHEGMSSVGRECSAYELYWDIWALQVPLKSKKG